MTITGRLPGPDLAEGATGRLAWSRSGRALLARYRWCATAMGLGTGFWFKLLLLALPVAAFVAGNPLRNGPPLWLLGPFVLVVGGAWLAALYLRLACEVNATTLRRDPAEGLSVRHGPLPYAPAVALPTADGAAARLAPRSDGTWKIVVETPAGAREVPLPGLDDVAVAARLNHLLAQRAGPDDPGRPAP